MSAALVNRSLTTIRTELEFLKDSEVITEELFEKLVDSIPVKYQKDSAPWGVDKLGGEGAVATTALAKVQTKSSAVDVVSEKLSNTTLSVPPPAYPPAQPPQSNTPKPLGYCTATYDYKAQQSGDLDLSKGDKLAITEHLSEDWWKGYKRGSGPEKTGVFPSNYVQTISESEYETKERAAPAPYQQNGYSAYGTPNYQQQPPLSQHNSYNSYNSFPPANPNAYPPIGQQQQVVEQQPQQQQSSSHEGLKRVGKKFGDSVVFGAGATVGSNIINSIF
ncbi:PIN3 [PSI+] inducibility protein 3 [Candida maltosa Xu316]